MSSPDHRTAWVLAVAVAGLALVTTGLPAVADPIPAARTDPTTTTATGTPATEAGTPGPRSDRTLVVDGEADGDDAYATIQAAVDAAAPGDTVLVRPGTYHEAVTVAVDITLRAPRGATLNGRGLDATAGITIGVDAAPTIVGFTVVGYEVGVDAAGTRGDWTVANSTFRGFYSTTVDERVAVDARRSSGDWTVVNSTFLNSNDGIDATEATGDWVVRASTFLGNGYGIDASFTTGEWVVVDSTFRRNRDGIEAWYAAGEWVVRDSTFRHNREGVYTSHTDDAWLITNTTFRNNTIDGVDGSGTSGNWTIRDSVFIHNGNAIDAIGTNGSWAVHESIFVDSDRSGIIALGAVHEGDARRNWWGNASGPDIDDCYGNVDCSDPLGEPPIDNPAFRGRRDAEAWNSTPVVTVFERREPTATAPNRQDLRGPGTIVGAVLLAVMAIGGVLGPILYVRRYGLQ